MHRFTELLRFFPLAVLVAAAFGALHDQLSYTVSAEYFTHFKFPQFGLLDASVPERLRAAAVGALASWWLGAVIGLLGGLGAFIHPTARQMRQALRASLLLACGLTLLAALLGLLYGVLVTADFDVRTYRGRLPASLHAPDAFLRAAYMHNAAYLGGALSLPACWLFHWAYARRCARQRGADRRT